MNQNNYKSIIQDAGDGFFVGISPGGHAQIIDTKSDRKAAASPVEMLLLAVGGCTAADVASILEKKRQVVTAYRVEVTGERREEHPRSFTRINVHHIVYGRNVSEAAVARAIELSDEKYCSVSATIKPKVEITTSFEVIEADSATKRSAAER